jgi:hypothetical protein
VEGSRKKSRGASRKARGASRQVKIGVVQTVGSLHNDTLDEHTTVLADCVRSVKAWSKLKGYEHCLITQPDTVYTICKSEAYNRGFRKFEVCAQAADLYDIDYIIYLDSDMLCWGNPTLPVVEDHFCVFQKDAALPTHTHPWYDQKLIPNGFFFSGPKQIFKQLYQWICDQDTEGKRCDGIVSDRYLEFNNKQWVPGVTRSYPIDFMFHDETALRHWVHDNRSIVKTFKPYDFISDLHNPHEMAPNKFFHYQGANKDVQHFWVWEAICAYKTDKKTYNKWRTLHRQLLLDHPK